MLYVTSLRHLGLTEVTTSAKRHVLTTPLMLNSPSEAMDRSEQLAFPAEIPSFFFREGQDLLF